MGLPRERTGGFTYADYLTWPEEERWELIEGVAWSMSPAPGRSHQRILLNLARLFADITDSGPCETYLAPFDVRLAEDQAGGTAGSTAPVGDGPDASTTNPTNDAIPDDAITTVVQPDISVFCRPEILDEAGARGAPDLVVEILSPSTSYKDQTQKLSLYEWHGVKEYWIVNADARWVMVYRRGADNRFGKPDYYRAGPEGGGPESTGQEGTGQEGEVITSAVLGGAGIPMDSFL